MFTEKKKKKGNGGGGDLDGREPGLGGTFDEDKTEGEKVFCESAKKGGEKATGSLREKSSRGGKRKEEMEKKC